MARYAVTITGLASGQVIQNKIHVTSVTPGNPLDEPGLLASRIEAAWRLNVLGLLCADYAFIDVKVVSIFDDTIQATQPATGHGSITSEPLPTWVTLRVKWGTGLGGWAGKGRMGLSPIPESGTTGNLLTTIYQSAAQPAMVSFLSAVNGTTRGYVVVVTSAVVNGAPRPLQLDAAITSVAVPLALGSQNSRKP